MDLRESQARIERRKSWTGERARLGLRKSPNPGLKSEIEKRD